MKTVSFTPPPLGFGFKNITSGYIVRGKKVGGRDGNKWGRFPFYFHANLRRYLTFVTLIQLGAGGVEGGAQTQGTCPVPP